MSRVPGRWTGWLLLALLGSLYTWSYFHDPLYPGNAPVAARQGWWSWSDQYKYYQATEALARGSITKEVYHYPLGYSLLGVPFVRWWPAHVYFVPDLLLVLVSAVLWWRLIRRWLSARAALVAVGAFLLAHGALLRLTMVVPWNTLATQPLLLAGMLALLEYRERRAVWALAGLTAFCWLVRPIDAVCFAPMLVWSVVRLSAWRDRISGALGGLAIIGMALGLVGALNLAVFGSWRSPYELASLSGIGFFSYPFDQKLFWTFVDARPFFGESDTALLWRYPWLFAVVPGMIFWVKREGGAGAAALGSIAFNWLLYLGYNDFFPSSIYRFSLIHSVSWSFLPLWACVAGACWEGWKIRAVWAGWGLAAALLVLACGLHLEERIVQAETALAEVTNLPKVRPLWVRFPGESLEQVSTLRLDGRPMQEAADFQIPYVPSELKLMLGARAVGTKLTVRPETGLKATPQVGDFRWAWRWGR